MTIQAQQGDWADYTYVVKEDPHNLGNWYLQCCPNMQELSMIDKKKELHLQLPRGISYEKALGICRYVQENLPVIKIAHFK